MELEYLKLLNSQLESLIVKRQNDILREQRSIDQLFDRGCGFTEYLVNMFCYLSWSDIEICRLVCKKWKNFIDRSI